MKYAILTVRDDEGFLVTYSGTSFENDEYHNTCTALSDNEYICVTVYEYFSDFQDDIEMYGEECSVLGYTEVLYQ